MSDPSNASAAPALPPVDEHDALPAGTRFGELEILRVVGVGGFGIVYLARDHSLDRDVALKEYMPGQLAARGPSAQVSVRSGSHMETFALGLRSFVNEARLLARFDHRSLVKVYRFWEANNTAYMVMPFLQGRTLREARRAMNKAPDEAWLRQTLNPLFEALEILHRETVYHRDIAPDNILLPHDGSQAVLLDFGAARRAIGDRTQTFTAILKPSYAPIEQYAESVSLRQGPWTDLYAMGAVIHYLLKGVPPPPATARTFEDHSEVLAELNFPGVSRTFLAAVDWALAVRPQDRPQSVAEFRDALNGRITPQVAARKPPPAPLSSDAFVRTAADPTRPMTQPAHPTHPPTVSTAGAEATVISWPQEPATEIPAGSRTVDDSLVRAKAFGDPTAPFKPLPAAEATRAPAWSPQPLAAPAPAARMPATAARDPGPRPQPALAAAKATAADAASPSAVARYWPFSIPVVLLLVAAAAWWWSAKRETPADTPPAANAAASAAAPSAVLAPPVAPPAIPKEVPAAATPSVPVATSEVPPSSVATPPAAPPASPSAATAAAKAPPAATATPAPTAAPRPNNGRPEATAAATPSPNPNTQNNNSGATPRIVLEPRAPRAQQANDGGRANANEGQRTNASPMWPPAPPAAEESPRPKPTAAAPRAADPPDNPVQICAPRSFLLRLACMDRECRSARFASHPQCAEIRARDEMRQNGGTYGGNR